MNHNSDNYYWKRFPSEQNFPNPKAARLFQTILVSWGNKIRQKTFLVHQQVIVHISREVINFAHKCLSVVVLFCIPEGLQHLIPIGIIKKKESPRRRGQRGTRRFSYSSDDNTSEEENERKKDYLLKKLYNKKIRRNYHLYTFKIIWSKLDRFLGNWANQRQFDSTLRRTEMTRSYVDKDNITTIALTSRLIILLLQITVSKFDYAKHQNDGFKFTPESGYGNVLDKFVNSTLGGFANWDGQYFLHIAVNGYTQENLLAFFPLFPMTLFYVSKAFHIVLGFLISLSSIILIVGWILNTAAFVMTASTLYKITQLMDNRERDYTQAVILIFCFNPASIFFSSLYTESFFAFLTTNVIFALYERKPLQSIVWASLSTVCRSNGLLNFGFITIYLLQETFVANRWRSSYHIALVQMFLKIFVMLVFLVPFAAFQSFAIWKFCGEEIMGEQPPYCNYTILPYAYVQKQYWNVGFMRYFELKQLPNFLMALPVLYFLVTESWKRVLLLLAKSLSARYLKDMFHLYVGAYGAFLAVFCFLCIHVQVSTRLIFSAFPHLFFYLAESCHDDTSAFRKRLIQWPIYTTSVQVWCLFYFIIGAIAFTLDYPWT